MDQTGGVTGNEVTEGPKGHNSPAPGLSSAVNQGKQFPGLHLPTAASLRCVYSCAGIRGHYCLG